MWWYNGLMLKRTEAFLKAKAELHKVLYVTVANEGPGMGVNALAEILKQHAPKGLAWRFDEYLDEIHGTISYKSTYSGLKFAFSDWRSAPVRFETKGDLLADGRHGDRDPVGRGTGHPVHAGRIGSFRKIGPL